MKIVIQISGGKPGPDCQAGITEYRKRLSRQCTLDWICVREQPRRTALSTADQARRRQIRVHSSGAVYTSPDLAAQLRAWIDSGCQQLLFIIEPPDLLTPIAEADQTLAISPLDLPTELAALLLAEQIYRAYRIIDNQPYHK